MKKGRAIMNRKIVRRTYTKENGVHSDRIQYAASPPRSNAYGIEMFHDDIQMAYLFKEEDLVDSYVECTINGNDRTGDFSYKQDIINVTLNVSDNTLPEHSIIPDKDIAVGIGYDTANNKSYTLRMVLRDEKSDCYYSGWLDCYDWLTNILKTNNIK